MRRIAAVVVLLSGCTSLGPMPAITGVPPVPISRPGAQVGLAMVPGYYISSGVTEKPRGAAMPQLSALLEPDRWLGVPGLIVGARLVGNEDAGTFLEPLLGYRRSFGDDHRFAFDGVGYVTRASHSDRDASLSVTRLGGEIAGDVRATPVSKWVELHFVAGAALTALWADGRYCLDAMGEFGVDCPEPSDMENLVAASASGLYPSGHAGAALELGQHLISVFHGIRLGITVAAGTMPTAIGGKQADAHLYAALGLSLSVGLGAKDATSASTPTAP